MTEYSTAKELRYEKLEDIVPITIEELKELMEELEQEELDLTRIYEECQDVSMVLISLFNTVRQIKKETVLQEGCANQKEVN